jgi:RHS repeat-associated protein
VSSVAVNYSGDDSRVSEVVDGAAVSYLVDDQNPTGWSQVVETRVGGAVQQVFVIGRKAVSLRTKAGASWNTSYYEQDGHGSAVALTDGTGATTDRYEYDAFGTVVANVGTSANPILYSGEWIDAGLGLQYLRARWYQPGAGRFESGDTYSGKQDEPLSLNRYAYVRGNPSRRTDPSGFADSDLQSLELPDYVGGTGASHFGVKETLFGTTQVYVRWRPFALPGLGLVFSHAYVVVQDSSNSQYVFNGYGGEKGGGPPPFGYLTEIVEASGLGENNGPSDQSLPLFGANAAVNVVNCMKAEADLISSRHILYWPLGPNSNSAAHDVLKQCGFVAEQPDSTVIGWDDDLHLHDPTDPFPLPPGDEPDFPF